MFMVFQERIVCRFPMIQHNATTKTFATIVLSQVVQPARSKLVFVWLYLGRPMLKRFQSVDIVVHKHTCFIRAKSVGIIHDMIWYYITHAIGYFNIFIHFLSQKYSWSNVTSFVLLAFELNKIPLMVWSRFVGSWCVQHKSYFGLIRITSIST